MISEVIIYPINAMHIYATKFIYKSHGKQSEKKKQYVLRLLNKRFVQTSNNFNSIYVEKWYRYEYFLSCLCRVRPNFYRFQIK